MYPLASGGRSLKSRCRQGRAPSESGWDPCLPPLNFCWCLSTLGMLWLVEASLQSPASVITWFSVRVCVCVRVRISPSYKDTSHIGFGPTLLQYDLLLTNYICKDSISIDPVPNSWRVGRGHIFRGLEGSLTTPAEPFCRARSHIHGLLERSVDHYLAPPHGPALMELTVPRQLTSAPEVGGTEATVCRVCTGVWMTC